MLQKSVRSLVSLVVEKIGSYRMFLGESFLITRPRERKWSLGQKGTRELNNLISYINYDMHSGSTLRDRNKGRANQVINEA
jgi:hypothetical protein